MDLLEEAGKAIISASARASIAALVKRLGSKAKKPIDQNLVQSRMQLYASQVSRVKTLLSPDTLVSIDDFYCTPRLSSRGTVSRPKSSSDFREDHVLIEGVAGQGKSILLRTLCTRSILDLGKIALYYELRRLDRTKPIFKIIQESVSEFGLPGSTEGLKTLAVERDIEIYLDGFDELDQKAAEKVDRDINYISLNHPFIKIFVSSRPHVGLAKGSSLQSYKIEPLDRSDIHRLIRKLCPEVQISDSLIKNLDFHQGRALDLLETPLLVTLLVSQYVQTQQLPEQLAEFYDNIFPVLFERHDSFKVPYVRQKLLGLTTHSYRKLFQQFCYGSLFAPDLNNETASNLAGWAMSSHSVTGNPEDFLTDIHRVSSLVNEEGGHWSFIHNSIQEFYAASHLLAGSDSELRSHGQNLSHIPNLSSRDQIFRFALEINEARFIEFVQVPFYEGLLNPLDASSDLTSENLAKWLIEHVHTLEFDNNRIEGGKFFTIRTDIFADAPLRMFAPDSSVGEVMSIINGTESVRAKVADLLRIQIIRSRLETEARTRIEPYQSKKEQADQFVRLRRAEGKKSDAFLREMLRKPQQN